MVTLLRVLSSILLSAHETFEYVTLEIASYLVFGFSGVTYAWVSDSGILRAQKP